MNMPKSCLYGHFELFLDPLTHSKALHTTKEVNLSMLKGSYSPKILHKIVLPEIGLISIFFGVKMLEKSSKCHISWNFG